MNFTVCYIGDQRNAAAIHAADAESAARRFLAINPRSDESQITVESVPTRPHWPPAISHFRACDLCRIPAPPEEIGEEDLAFRTDNYARPDPYCDFIVSGSAETLRLLATRLLAAVDQLTTGSDSVVKRLYRVSLVPGDVSRVTHSLSFEFDPDPSRHWVNRSGSLRRKNSGVFFFRSIVFILAAIGLWTVGRWIF